MANQLVLSGELVAIHLSTSATDETEPLWTGIESDLTDVAQHELDSEDVKVEVKREAGSLELAAVISCGKLVMDAGEFFTGLRECRRRFPKRVGDRLSTSVDPDVTVDVESVEVRDGLLRGRGEEAATKASEPADDGLSVRDLVAYAGLSLVVLLVIALAVAAGVAILV